MRLQKELEKKRHQDTQAKMEAKKKELMRQQVEKRKLDEIERAQRARDMIDENRRRVQLQSELLKRGQDLDPVYRQHLHQVTGSNIVNIAQET